MSRARIFLAAVAGCVAVATSTMAAAAGNYPDQPVHIVVPYAAGGQFDTVARMLGKFAAEKLGQGVVIENVPGGGGNIGAAKVARANPDGYTLLTMGANHAVADALYAKPGYRVLQDFAPISMVTVSPHVVLVNQSLPVKTFGELVAYSKQHPDAINYGTPGAGTSMHLTFEMIRNHYAMNALHVPYGGGSKMLMDLAGGRINTGIVAIAPALQIMKTGRVRALAVTSKQRSPELPDVPALSEIGFPSLDAGSWLALVGPKGMPADAVARWNEVIKQFVSDPASSKTLREIGFQVKHTSPGELAKFLGEQHDAYGKVVRDNKISAD